MGSNEEIGALASELKEHLRTNGGEVVYWGEALPSFPLSTCGNDELPKSEQLKILREETIGDCRRCPLAPTRIKLVFGVGNPEAEVMFVGEGPGFDEDRQGEPFVGKAGRLLDKIMAAIGLDRSKAYIANVVKCHPMIDPSTPDKRGNDRPPSPEEMEECLPFLRRQIDIIRPRFIVTLGAVATRALLARREGITSLRGKFFDFSIGGTSGVGNQPSIKLLPTFHPAALLRDETLKRSVWEDMKLLRDALKSSFPHVVSGNLIDEIPDKDIRG